MAKEEIKIKIGEKGYKVKVDSMNLATPTQVIRKKIVRLGGRGLWHTEVGPITNRFYLEAFFLKGIIILQSWPDGGAEIYTTVTNSITIAAVTEWLEEHAKSKLTPEEQEKGEVDADGNEVCKGTVHKESFPESRNMVDAFLDGRDGKDQ